MCKSALVGSVLALAACIEQPGPEIDVVPKIAVNSLTPGFLTFSQLTTSVLDSSSAVAMGPNKQARSVLAFAAGCALDATQTVSYTLSAGSYTLTGAMGIAPEWTTSGLTAIQAAWVSACVLSRVNLTSAYVTISARGDNVGVETTLSEVDEFAIEEGAFWGNAFVDLGSVAEYSCNGVDQAANDTYGDLPLRECAEWDGVAGSQASPCGMHYAGLCSDVCSTSSPPYAGCSFQGGTASAAVVTTFLYGLPE
jgi:hypothetical protein